MDCESNFEINPELAKRLFEEGGTLVVLNVPPETDFGIDIKSWTTEENFKGVKMIPPGFHFIHYSAINKHGDMAPRVGFFHVFQRSELLVKQWDVNAEEISNQSVPEEVVTRLKSNLKNLDKYLGPYPYDLWSQWKDLTDKITPQLVQRCSPVCGFMRSALELVNMEENPRPKSGESSRKRKRTAGLSVEEREEQLLPNLKPTPGTELRLTELPDKMYPDDATPMEVTQHSLDFSYALEVLINKLPDPMDVVGEMQLAFVCFLAGQSLDAFEHWKKMVSLLCNVDKNVPHRRAIYAEFLKTLETQLNYVPEEVLCDIVASNNFVYHNLRKLFAIIEANPEVDGRLKSLANRTKDRIRSKFLWDFNNLQDEIEDELPLVVEIE